MPSAIATGLRHVAIIMDGNRRWAKDHNLPSLVGHQQGVETLKKLVRHVGDLGLGALTVYAFSTENWQRTEEEVGYLMGLFVSALGQEIQNLHGNNVRVQFIGDLRSLPDKLQIQIAEAHRLTADNTGLCFQIATNYGSRSELVTVCRQLAQQVKDGQLDPNEINETHIDQLLYTKDLPPLDLLIRTGGESRLSNYLLWQAAYAEFYVTDTLWPEFTPEAFNAAMADFTHRQRRYGK